MADAKPRCRLYFQVPAPLTAKLETLLTQALAETSAACVLLCSNDQPLDEDHADRLIDLVQAAGVACLIADDFALAERLGADGVHLAASADLAERYAQARALLGESASIGASCGVDRHEAMQLAEKGIDYVAFGPGAATTDIDTIDQLADRISWWAEIFVVPCIAWNVDDPAQAARLAELGADFVAPSPALWQDEDALGIIAAIDSAIARTRSAA